MSPELGEPQGLGVADEDAEDAASSRQVADPSNRFLVEPRGDEVLEAGPALVDDAEGRLLGAVQLGGGLDDPLQDGLDRELGGDGDRGVEDGPQPVLVSLRHVAQDATRVGARPFSRPGESGRRGGRCASYRCGVMFFVALRPKEVMSAASDPIDLFHGA